MPLATAGDEFRTRSRVTPLQTGGQMLAPQPPAANPNRKGAASSVFSREAMMTKPLLTAGVVAMLPPRGIDFQTAWQDPPDGTSAPGRVERPQAG